MDWSEFRKETVQNMGDLATAKGKDTLVFYLVSRFILILVAVVVAESFLIWLESITLLPLLQSLSPSQADTSYATTSIFSLAAWAFSLLSSIVNASVLPAGIWFARFSAFVLVLVMFLVLIAPVLVGAAVFSTMIKNRVSALYEQRERELEETEKRRSQFMTDIAHDLRTPLMAISGMSHAMLDGVVRDEAKREEYLQSICDQSDKMNQLVSTVFDYTKLGSDAFELNREVVDLSQLLLGEAALAYTDIEEAGMLPTNYIPEDRCAIFADPVQIRRVVGNLVANAIRYNEPGAEICVLLVRQAAVAFVLVADTGSAIPGNPEDLFEPFVQGDSARTSSRKGSGLGLSICKRIADKHGYNLSVVQPYGRFTKAFVLQCSLCE